MEYNIKLPNNKVVSLEEFVHILPEHISLEEMNMYYSDQLSTNEINKIFKKTAHYSLQM